jgi:RND family efflux transporter MFP subunit
MPVGTVDPPRDNLSRLRIQRDVQPVRRSFFGRFLRLVFYLGVLVALAVGAVFWAQKQGMLADTRKLTETLRPRPEVRVAVVSVEKGRSADALVVATGYLESRQQARIGARATGRIQAVNVEEGTVVKANDVLAILEHADLDASLVAVKATAARAKSELLEQDVAIQRARRDLERAEKAFAAKSATPADHDKAQFDYEAAVARKVSMEAALGLAEARVQEAEQLRENMFVRAPFEGTVISKDAELGESIMPGGMGEASGRGSVVTIADLEHLEVDCDVKEDYISRVTEGQQAEVAVDAVPDKRYKGQVRKIIPMGDRARSTVKVKVEILDSDKRLFPEMSSTVYFLPGQSPEVKEEDKSRVFCPADAVIVTETESFVWILTDKDRTKKTMVTTADSRDGRTEITSGLTGGEKVIVKPAKDLRDDVLVRSAQ